MSKNGAISSSFEETTSIFLKIIIIGEATVGKTSLLYRYVNKKFIEGYKTTIGADFLTKTVMHQGKKITLQIWDTAGTERFSVLGRAFYRGSDCCFIVFDVTRPITFRSLDTWYDNYLNYGQPRDLETFPIFVIGNKIDLVQNRKISAKTALDWCVSKNIRYFETSVKEDINIDDAFEKAIESALLREKEKMVLSDPKRISILSDNNPDENKKSCCNS